MDQPQPELTNNLAVMLPVMLAVTVGVGYALNSVLRDKGLGIFGNGAVMMVGMALRRLLHEFRPVLALRLAFPCAAISCRRATKRLCLRRRVH